MAVWGYGLLGPVEVRVDDRAVELTSASQRLVLAMLLLAAGQLVPADRLMDELWGEALPRDPPAALRTQISRLRRALGPAGGSLVTADGGYRLSVQRHQLDAARFEDALAAAAHAAGEQGLSDSRRGTGPVARPGSGRVRGPAVRAARGCPARRAAGGGAGTPGRAYVVAGVGRGRGGRRCRRSWPSTRNGSGRGGCSCRPSTRAAGTPRPWPRSGPGAATCPRISGWTPHLPWNASSRTSCGTRCRWRSPFRGLCAGRCRCR